MEYQYIIIESYYESGSGLHGNVHFRPLPDQDPFLPSMHVACSHILKDENDYTVGTRFRIKAKITSREGGMPFVYSNYNWPYQVIED